MATSASAPQQLDASSNLYHSVVPEYYASYPQASDSFPLLKPLCHVSRTPRGACSQVPCHISHVPKCIIGLLTHVIQRHRAINKCQLTPNPPGLHSSLCILQHTHTQLRQLNHLHKGQGCSQKLQTPLLLSRYCLLLCCYF